MDAQVPISFPGAVPLKVGVLFVPGGFGANEAMRDGEAVETAKRHRRHEPA